MSWGDISFDEFYRRRRHCLFASVQEQRLVHGVILSEAEIMQLDLAPAERDHLLRLMPEGEFNRWWLNEPRREGAD